jgi:hypothetical protein
MDILTRYLARKANRVALGLWMCILASGLSGCASNSQTQRTPIERLNFNNPSPASSAGGVQQGLSVSDYDPKYRDAQAKLGLSEDQSRALGCNIGDRFDRGATLAYNFDDNQTRIALNLSLAGPTLSDPTHLELNSVLLRYTHKFSKPPVSRREKCRFQSSFQGLVGSAYNELFIRNSYTVWKELRNKFNGK